MENKYDLFGLYLGTVTNTTDPLSNNRVRLNIPQVLGKAQSNWANPAGEISTPVIKGQQVYVMFLGGDATKPVYMVKGN